MKEESSGDEYDALYASDTTDEVLEDGHDASNVEGFNRELPSALQPDDLLAAAEECFLRSSPKLGLGTGSKGRGKGAYVVYCGWKTGVFGSW